MITSYSQFQELVQTYRGQAKQFEQGAYLAMNRFDAEVQDGVCRGLSAAYILRNFLRGLKSEDTDRGFELNSEDLDEHFGRLKFFTAFRSHDPESQKPVGARGPKDENRFEKIALVQKKYAKGGELQETDLIDAANKTVAALSEGNMRYKEHAPVITFGAGFRKQLFAVTPGYWLISSGKHMMAACTRNFGLKAKFFDPNRGQARFGGAEDLAPFLQAYLDDQGYQMCFLIRYG